MPQLQLDLRAQAAGHSSNHGPFALTSTNVSRGYLPGRGLLYSLLIHEIVFAAILFFSVPHNLREQSRPPKPAQEPSEVIYLPMLGGGGEGMGRPAVGLEAARKGPSVDSAPSAHGFSYPGPQPILSDLTDPTNNFQTLLQPALANAPILKPGPFLPNLVQMADAGPVPQLEPPEPAMKPPAAVQPAEQQPAAPPRVQPEVKAAEPVLPTVKLTEPAPTAVDTPELPVRASVSQNAPVPETKPPEPPARIESPEPVTAPQKPPPPKEVKSPEPSPNPVEQAKQEAPRLEFSPRPSRGTDLQNLLALTPMPAPAEQSVKVPFGEARGRFAISPEPNLAASEAKPGSKIETPPSAVGIATQTAVTVGNAVATDGGDSAGASGAGAGTARSSGVGSAPGPGRGSGPGAGAGPGKSAFPGITILGGHLETGTARNSAVVNLGPPPAPPPPPAPARKKSYGVIIMSTEDSGGGLAKFKVFSNEQVYTVYLDMRRTATDPSPSWTAEYAVLRGTAAQADAAQSPIRSQQGLVLPFPSVKEQPVLPADLVRRYLRKLVVVYAIINTDGKMEQVSVKESPDTQLNEPVLNALAKWIFRPGELNGERVAVKVLLGIPLSLPE